MTGLMFLDDLRNPVDVSWVSMPSYTNSDWAIVRSYDEAVVHVLSHGWPEFIAFDHDLGDVDSGKPEKTGYDFARWLIEYDLDGNTMPDNFKFVVHSMNHIGGKRITALFENYFKERD